MPVKPVINYKLYTDSTNNKVVFRESTGGSWLTATLTTAANPTTGEYAASVKSAMDLAGAEAYTISYSRSTRKFTIASSGGAYLSIDWTTAGAAASMLGFSTAAVDTGATSYAADTTSATEIRFTEGVKNWTPGHQSFGALSESDDGTREHTYKYLENLYAVEWTLMDVGEKDSYATFSTGWACKGKAFDYYPSATGSTFYRLQLTDPFRKITFSKTLGLDIWDWADEFRYL